MDSETPSALFESYEQDFVHLIQGIREKLDDAKNVVGEQRKATLRRVEIELDEADDIVSQLEIELQGIPTSIKSQYSPRLKQAKSELSKYKKVSKEMHAAGARGELLGGSRASPRSRSDDPYGNTPTDRERLLVGHGRLQDSTRRLQDSTSLAYQTESYGAEILSTLRGQREQIEGARDTLNTADANIDRSSNTIGKMIRQMHKQRFIIAGIITFFVALILLILYFKLVR